MIVQMAVPYAVLLLTAFLAGIGTVFSGVAAVLVETVLIAVVLALLAFALGAAFGAIGEAVRGDAPSPYFERARSFFWRTLGTFLLALLAAVPALIVGAFGFLLAMATVVGALMTPSATAGPLYLSLGIIVVFFALAIATVPFVYSLEAGVFVAGRTVPESFRAAFSEAYRGGRLWRWVLIALIVSALGLLGDLLRAIPGVVGVALGLIVSVATLWAGTTLAFVNWQANRS
ncbi:MAG: hypothetical protein M0Z66_04905 [Thermaerobacter sp.]|nr:hypothetical protein [Thermaerobacter sp.]